MRERNLFNNIWDMLAQDGFKPSACVDQGSVYTSNAVGCGTQPYWFRTNRTGLPVYLLLTAQGTVEVPSGKNAEGIR